LVQRFGGPIGDADEKMPAIERVSLMDGNHVAELLRTLRSTPSRRAVATALLAVASSTAFSPFVDRAVAGSKGGGGKRGGKKKRKDKKKKKWNIDELPPLPPLPPPCPLGQSLCGDATSGNRFCYSSANETCCPVTVTGIAGACPKQTFCATGAGKTVPICCPSGSEHCGAGCCPQGTFCCGLEGVCCDSACLAISRTCFPIPLGTLARTK
jgi:hypothetical protein